MCSWPLRGRGFFFQAEDGIRDSSVTGVQTCALPISWPCHRALAGWRHARDGAGGARPGSEPFPQAGDVVRGQAVEQGEPVVGEGSEERRGGKEGRSRWAPYHLKKKKTSMGQ